MKPCDAQWAADLIASKAGFFPRVDAKLMAAEITSRLSQKLNYCARTEDSVIVTLANVTPFTDKRVASIDALIVGKNGDGLKLLREYIAWWQDKPVLRGIVWTPMFNWDDRFERMMARLGFDRAGGCFHKWRNGNGLANKTN